MLIYNPVDFFYLTRITQISRRAFDPLVRPFGTMQSVFGSKDSGRGVNFFEELRPERPKAHSPGQGEQREPTPWVCSIPTTWRPERAKALNHKTVCWIITYFCRAFALSGRNLCVGLLSQGVAPCSRLPWAGSYCPFRARNDSALFYLLMGTLRNVPNGKHERSECILRNLRNLRENTISTIIKQYNQ